MAGRSAPTVRRIRVATELRRLREHAGLTATEAARVLGTSQGQLSNVETARFGVSASRIRAMARSYDCSDQAFIDALVNMAEDRTRGWWEEYREILPAGLLDLAEVEHHATRLSTAITVHIPGLLQTTDHARELFLQVVPELPPPEVEHRVSFRIKRQAVLFRDPPTPYRAIIHEAALRMQFGGPVVTKGQLQHLLEMSERKHVTIQVLPFAAGSFPGSGQSLFYSGGSVPQLDTVHLDQSHGPVFIDAAAQLCKYRVLLERMDAKALPPEKSQDLIRGIAQNL
ncbi:XRE family transcriptional regulator [Streptomyces kanamyceticus]|uniref:XRE family transcriptional regulator n=1 Tax=Streptomyces kanamyceticus TaxID=1967 RepID=A0A5J6GHN9_STRKN|nr:helix-turn-helix transcriptional regulator [Streptomyces kanamyceticus]QEU93415.1 XRE family transcriptional regulator [Streptomyces kanamyceticus]